MLASQNLLRRKVRTFVALLGIAIGISAVVSIVSMAQGLRAQFYKIAEKFAFDVIVQAKGVPSPITSFLDAEDKDAILALPGVKAVSPFGMYFLRRKDTAHPQPVFVLGLEPGSEVLSRYEIVRGRTLAASDTSQPCAKNVDRHTSRVALSQAIARIRRSIRPTPKQG